MKKVKKLCLIFTLILPAFLLCSCTTNNSENLAKDLDSTVKNLVIAVSSLDWPADGDLDSFNNIQHISSTTQTSESTIVVDTQIDTSEIYTWLETTHSKINVLLSKRGDLLLYLNEMYGGNTQLSEEDVLSINVYMNILKDNSNYLSSYNGMLKNQIEEAKEIYANNQNVNLINAYLIKAVETLQVRCAKIDTSILAMTSIIDIIKNNLINNYFNYNQHNISEQPQVDEDDTISKNDTPIEDEEINNEEINIEESTTQNENNSSTTQEDNIENIEQPQEENAINFNGETTEVQTTQEDSAIEADNINYDDQIKTLEEPIIDDVSEIKSSSNNKLINEENSTSVIEENIKLSEENKDIKEIDKDFSQDLSINKEDSTVTREIIKENIV